MSSPPAPATDPGLPRARSSRAWKFALVLLVVTCAIAVAVAIVLPRYIRATVIAKARDAGVHLTIDAVELGLSGVTLREVTATSASVNGITAHATEILATGLHANNLLVSGATLDLDVDPETLRRLIASAPSQNDNGPLGRSVRQIDVASARIAWRGIAGKDSLLEAGAVEVHTVLTGANVDSLVATFGRFDLTVNGKLLGPWSARVEQASGNTDAKVSFTPTDPEGPHADVHLTQGRLSAFACKIPSTSLAKLGVRQQDLGPTVDPQSTVELALEGSVDDSDKVDANGELHLHRVHVQGITAPIDVRVSARARGPAGEPLVLRDTSVGFGPFTATVKGTVTPRATGLRVDAAYDVTPIACADLVRAEAAKMGSFASLVQDFAQSTGAARVGGHVEASGRIEFDSTAPENATLSLEAKNTCSVSLFGR